MLNVGRHEDHGKGFGKVQGHFKARGTGHLDIEEGRIRLRLPPETVDRILAKATLDG